MPSGLRFAAAVVVLAVGVASCDRIAGGARPNLLLITLDTTRADRLGCYGYRSALTPALDALAAHGTLFEQAFTSCPMTLPAHATMLTGLDPPEHGLHMNGKGRLDAGVVTLAETLLAHGYRTGAFVAAFVLDRRFGLNRGFQVYDDDLRTAATQEVPEPLSVSRPGNIVTDAALAWLGTVVDDTAPPRPFFCWVHLYEPHYPYEAHAELAGTPFEGKTSYDAEIAFMDRQVGRIVRFLADRHLTERTVVVVAGDHGEGLNDHSEVEHGYLLNQEVLHVPLIVAQPGRVAEGQRVDTLSSLLDLYPTVTELLGLRDRVPGRGRSLAPALVGTRIPPQASYAETDLPYVAYGWSPLRSLTTPRWKYVRTPTPELYDRSADPRERRNLADDFPDRVREFEAMLTGLERGMIHRDAPAAALDAEDRRRLEALGYVGDTPDPSQQPPSSLRDVKDMLGVKNLDAWLRAGMRAGSLSQPEILQVARELVRQSPETPAFQNVLATALMAAGQLDAGITHLAEALRLRPDFAEAHSNLGTALMRTGKLDESVAHFAEALRLEPELPEAQLGMGTALAVRGDVATALGHYREAIRLRPDYADAHQNLANVLASSGHAPQAIKHYKEALRIKSDFALAHHNLAQVLADHDRVRQAILHYREALRIAPQFASAYYNLGRLLEEEGRLPEAIASYREAVRLEPDDPAVLDNLAAAYAAAGRRQAAIATARRAADRARAAGEPTLAAAIERRAQLYGHLVLRHTPDPGG